MECPPGVRRHTAIQTTVRLSTLQPVGTRFRKSDHCQKWRLRNDTLVRDRADGGGKAKISVRAVPRDSRYTHQVVLIAKTFKRRGTAIPNDEPVALSAEFCGHPQKRYARR